MEAANPSLERLLSEMGEQPQAAARLIGQQEAHVRALALDLRRHPPRAAVLVGRGSSGCAAVYGRYLFEARNRLLTSIAAPSTVSLYGPGPELRGTVVVAVSQSGQSDDVIEFVRQARAEGAITVAVVNDARSPLATAAHWVLDCHSGPERSVPATKSVTAQMLLLAMLSEAMASGSAGPAHQNVPDALGRALSAQGEVARVIGSLLVDPASALSVIGRGFAFGPALELALKLKESCRLFAEGFSAADFFHGPVSMVDERHVALLVDVGGQSTGAALTVASEVTARGGRPLALRVGQFATSSQFRSLELPVPLAEHLAPIAAVALGQVFALELALALGHDPSTPRGLQKVTRTR